MQTTGVGNLDTHTINFFPDIGCLVGDETSELRDAATNSIKARRIQRLTSLESATAGFVEGKPSTLRP